MTINRAPYYDQVKDRWYVDKDPDNKWTYVGDMTSECTLNNTTVVSASAVLPDARMTVLKGPQVQGGKYVVLQVQGPSSKPTSGQDDASVTLRCICDNGDQFDKTIYFRSTDD